MASVPFVDVLAEHAENADEISAALAEAVEGGHWILGPEVALFEDEFASYCESRHAIGTDSGMSALALTLRALGIGAGAEVIAPANTFIATIFAIMHVGATPVLVDADPSSHCLDVDRLEEAVTPRTRAVIPVHLYGRPADMDSVLDVAHRHGFAVLEDACQAHGARLHGKRAGSFGNAAAFSFYPSKNLGAYGDGGIVVTDDDALAEELRMLRNYGQRRKYVHVSVGHNHRLDTLQAAILRVKLRSLDRRNAERRKHAALYSELLANSEVVTPVCGEGVEHVWHLYVIRTENRDELHNFLGSRGIETGIHYPVPVHLQEACAHLGYGPGSFPVSEQAAREVLSLPMYPQLETTLIEEVVAAIDEFQENCGRRASARSRLSTTAAGS
jgi:dTDP-4-amino-4,6-dideoxygalactose transaminase